jgi:hypothetical protein
MHTLQANRQAMFGKVHRFCMSHRETIAYPHLIDPILTRLDEANHELGLTAYHQRNHAEQSHLGTRDKHQARQSVRLQIVRISRVAKLIARAVPGFAKFFPLSNSRGDLALLETARLFQARIAVHAELFRPYAALVEELSTDVDKLQKALSERSQARSAHKDDTARMDAAIKKGMSAIAELDILVPHAVRHNRQLLDVWKRVRRVEPVVKKKKPAAKSRSASTAR